MSFKGLVSCQEKIMQEERTNAYPADRNTTLSPIVQSPLQEYFEGEGQQDPAARSRNLLQFGRRHCKSGMVYTWQEVFSLLCLTDLAFTRVHGWCQQYSKPRINRTGKMPWRGSLTTVIHRMTVKLGILETRGTFWLCL